MADDATHGGLTPEQRRAIGTVDRSVLVSAAAGSGKTTVLAERCAALVCDVEPDRRCGVDELLVVTFTEAAASEMRSRIRAALRRRREQAPHNAYLERQLHLLEQAGISTIHAFCRTLIQRWFPQAGVDPNAEVLDENEARLLRSEVLDALFVELYAGGDELGPPFQDLVDHYGNGSDAAIARIVLELHDFVSSLPDPRQWLDEAVSRLDPSSPISLIADLDAQQCRRLADELRLQEASWRDAAETMRRCWPVATSRVEAAEADLERIETWRRDLDRGGDHAWGPVAEAIRGFQFDNVPRKPSRLSDEDGAAFDAARDLLNACRERFKERVREAICRFTAEEYRDGLTRVAPFVRTLTQVVDAFDRRYRAAKSAQAAVDFNDLQRHAYDLLTVDGDPDRPSPVARTLQQQYRYVLVDEFQDIDPLQAAILRLASRESADPPAGNLFAVGDIKQSIYRFRLAEPALFARRADAFAAEPARGELIRLQQNFRSRASVIDAVNAIFRPLMSRDFGGSAYDASAELRTGAAYPERAEGPRFGRPAVELHLLEPVTQRTRRANDDGDETDTDGSGDQELEGIDREAYLIGERIRDWMGHNDPQQRWHVADKPDRPGGPPTTRPIEYRDIVILLRALPHKAQPIADVLRRMSIPVQVGRDDHSFDSTEFHDVVSLLSLLDNVQQDIPLAAVMRSPLVGDPLAETELLAIRLLDRRVPFHAAVAHYADNGPDRDLRRRVKLLLDTLDRYRTRIRRAPVADVLWDLYEQGDYLAYVAGLPDGLRRREHLLRLHELARQFGHFQRQGLRRFLRFVDEMVRRDLSPQPPALAGEDNVVRIMTIHASKGLEFPVVVLADVHKRFNLGDTRSPVLLDRELGIAPKVSDLDRRVFYPSFLHQLADANIRRENLSEELRILYVALSRAREHLLLVGRREPGKLTACRRGRAGADAPARTLPQLQRETAKSALDWLLAAISTVPTGLVRWDDEAAAGRDPLFEIHVYDRIVTDQWHIPPPVRPERADALARIARLEPLPASEPVADVNATGPVITALSEPYPALELTTLPARVSVSELERRWPATVDPDERATRGPRPSSPARPAFVEAGPADSALRRGTATHRFLQCIDLTRPCDAADLEHQREDLLSAGLMAPDDAGAIMLDAAAWLFSTELGQCLRRHADLVRREVPFIARVGPERYDPMVRGRDARDVVLVRGVVDVLIAHPSQLEIIDYKTDAVTANACEARAEAYRPQLELYADAMARIYRRDVTRRRLVFLHARRIIDTSTSD